MDWSTPHITARWVSIQLAAQGPQCRHHPNPTLETPRLSLTLPLAAPCLQVFFAVMLGLYLVRVYFIDG